MTEFKKDDDKCKSSYIEEIFRYILVIILGVSLGVGTYFFIGVRYSVNGESMYPTFNDKDELFVSKFNKITKHIDRGDIVVFHANEKRDYIKRVIGVPGDMVEYKKDTLYINGEKVNETYLKYNKEHKYGKQLTEDFTIKSLNISSDNIIPENKYLVLGDNRQNSLDSRIIGLVDEDKIVGEVVLRYKPNFTTDFKGESFNNVNN